MLEEDSKQKIKEYRKKELDWHKKYALQEQKIEQLKINLSSYKTKYENSTKAYKYLIRSINDLNNRESVNKLSCLERELSTIKNVNSHEQQIIKNQIQDLLFIVQNTYKSFEGITNNTYFMNSDGQNRLFFMESPKRNILTSANKDNFDKGIQFDENMVICKKCSDFIKNDKNILKTNVNLNFDDFSLGKNLNKDFFYEDKKKIKNNSQNDDYSKDSDNYQKNSDDQNENSENFSNLELREKKKKTDINLSNKSNKFRVSIDKNYPSIKSKPKSQFTFQNTISPKKGILDLELIHSINSVETNPTNKLKKNNISSNQLTLKNNNKDSKDFSKFFLGEEINKNINNENNNIEENENLDKTILNKNINSIFNIISKKKNNGILSDRCFDLDNIKKGDYKKYYNRSNRKKEIINKNDFKGLIKNNEEKNDNDYEGLFKNKNSDPNTFDVFMQNNKYNCDGNNYKKTNLNVNNKLNVKNNEEKNDLNKNSFNQLEDFNKESYKNKKKLNSFLVKKNKEEFEDLKNNLFENKIVKEKENNLYLFKSKNKELEDFENNLDENKSINKEKENDLYLIKNRELEDLENRYKNINIQEENEKNLLLFKTKNTELDKLNNKLNKENTKKVFKNKLIIKKSKTKKEENLEEKIYKEELKQDIFKSKAMVEEEEEFSTPQFSDHKTYQNSIYKHYMQNYKQFGSNNILQSDFEKYNDKTKMELKEKMKTEKREKIEKEMEEYNMLKKENENYRKNIGYGELDYEMKFDNQTLNLNNGTNLLSQTNTSSNLFGHKSTLEKNEKISRNFLKNDKTEKITYISPKKINRITSIAESPNNFKKDLKLIKDSLKNSKDYKLKKLEDLLENNYICSIDQENIKLIKQTYLENPEKYNKVYNIKEEEAKQIKNNLIQKPNKNLLKKQNRNLLQKQNENLLQKQNENLLQKQNRNLLQKQKENLLQKKNSLNENTSIKCESDNEEEINSLQKKKFQMFSFSNIDHIPSLSKKELEKSEVQVGIENYSEIEENEKINSNKISTILNENDLLCLVKTENKKLFSKKSHNYSSNKKKDSFNDSYMGNFLLSVTSKNLSNKKITKKKNNLKKDSIIIEEEENKNSTDFEEKKIILKNSFKLKKSQDKGIYFIDIKTRPRCKSENLKKKNNFSYLENIKSNNRYLINDNIIESKIKNNSLLEEKEIKPKFDILDKSLKKKYSKRTKNLNSFKDCIKNKKNIKFDKKKNMKLTKNKNRKNPEFSSNINIERKSRNKILNNSNKTFKNNKKFKENYHFSKTNRLCSKFSEKNFHSFQSSNSYSKIYKTKNNKNHLSKLRKKKLKVK